ncbi:hypothetical protein LTR08_005718 [Meristemomyces frigidus]|nr:hypothetical protein LTR08_005718 [Meristemomyces frigidus]
MSSAGQGIADLKDLVQRDIKASEDLQARIDELRIMISEGKTITNANALGDIETEGRRMLKDLIRRINQIEDQPSIEATDREMLQALNARQVVCDKQVMQLAELRDLHRQARGLPFEELGEYVQPAALLKPGTKARIYRKKKDDTAPEDAGEPSLPAMAPHAGATTAPGPSVEDVGEPVDPRDIGAAAYANSPPIQAEQGVHDGGVFQVVYDGEDEEEDAEHEQEWKSDSEPDSSVWPLCYRVLDVDPNTEPRQFEVVCSKAYRKLSLKHEPTRLPNDPDAPARWAVITKAYETLMDPARKQFYDMHGNEPANLKDFDLSKLSINDGH